RSSSRLVRSIGKGPGTEASEPVALREPIGQHTWWSLAIGNARDAADCARLGGRGDDGHGSMVLVYGIKGGDTGRVLPGKGQQRAGDHTANVDGDLANGSGWRAWHPGPEARRKSRTRWWIAGCADDRSGDNPQLDILSLGQVTLHLHRHSLGD